MHRLRSPREESSSSSHRRPFSAASSPSTARSKYSFPVVNTPVLRRARHNSENQPPENALNIKANAHPYSEANSPAPHLLKSGSSKGKLNNHHGSMSLPPRPPPPRPSPSVNSSSARNGQDHAQGNVKRKLNLEIPSVSAESNVTCVLSSSSDHDSGVKVIVRVRPCNNKEKLEEATEIVEKISENSLCIADQQFTFDHVATVESSQQSMFELVGQPLVENCLQGFNSSIFAYGQTGSGKTYTMWGSTQDLLAQSPCNERGLTPRVFERLFERIKEEEQKNTDKQLHYQCRCSFLEIYNEQITDLLEPLQKNLQVREDTKAGVYVENLREEFVANVHDVFRLMLKGLSNRRVASTSMNLESSRSHTLFMCVIESRCKSMADGVSSIRTSRMNLVDLAGSERQKLTGAAGERLKEAGNINRSLSQLGNLINILAEVSQTGRPRHIPYRDSRLTFLMQESLGGNAKLAMICAISPASSCKSETLSTLRFAQRAKSIQNKAVINEETENDVKLLREQIRQLKTELMRMKTNESPSEAAGSYSTCWNARRSYNLLRMSLSRPLTLPHCDTDTDEEMEIDEDAVEHIDAPEHVSISSVNCSLSKEDHQVLSPILSVSSVSNSSISSPKGLQVLSPVLSVSTIPDLTPSPPKDGLEMSALSSISLVKERLEAPILSLSPRLQQDTRKSFGVASILQESSDICQHEDTHNLEEPNCSLNHNDTKECSLENELLSAVEEEPSCCLDSPQGASELNQTLRESLTFIRSSLQFSKKLSCNTDTLAESLNHGLQIIQNNKKKTSRRAHASMAQFSFQKSMWDRKITSKSLQISAQSKVTMSLKGCARLGLINEVGSPQMVTESQSPLVDQTITFSSPEISSSPALPKVSRSQLLTEEDTCQIDSEFLSDQLFHKKPEISPVSSHEELEMNVPESMDHNLHSVEAVTVAVQTSPLFFPESPRMFNPVSEHMKEPVVKNVEEAAIQTSLMWSSQEIKISTNQDQNTQTILEAALRREGAMEETLNRKIAEIEQLNNLLHQYKQERECNAVLQRSSEEKIARLEKLMDGTIPVDVFLSEEWSSLINERKILQEKCDNHPEVTLANIKQQRLTEELEQYKSFCDQGERENLVSEISQLRNLLQSYVLDTSRSAKQSRTVQARLTAGGLSDENSPLYEDARNSTEERSSVVVSREACKACEESKQQWMEREEEWMSLIEELRSEVHEYKQQTKRRKHELEGQQRCADELKETLQIAMEGHARLLDQYAELQEKHISLLAKHRKVRDAMSEARKKAGKMQGFLGSKWFEAQAAELSAMKLEHEEEKRAAQEQIENLQSQVRDTADAVQAAGELLVRLKEAEEAALIAQDAAALAADDVEKLYREMDKLKRRHKTEIATMHQRLLEARFQKSKLCPMCVMAERVKFEFSGAEEEEEALLARSIAEDHLNNPGEEESNYCDDEDEDDHGDLYGEHLCAI